MADLHGRKKSKYKVELMFSNPKMLIKMIGKRRIADLVNL
jgi:hypothetical protein